MSASVNELAKLFGAIQSAHGDNVQDHIYPASNGLIFDGEAIRAMTWGFPLPQKSKKTGKPIKPKPVNNARTDKLETFFWQQSFEQRRCLIPVTAWAEAEGQRGSMTRTWQRLSGAEPFAVAGLWRPSDEWGNCYSMIMTDAVGPSREVHDRSPVILNANDYTHFLHGSVADAKALCVPFHGKIEIDRTSEAWFKR